MLRARPKSKERNEQWLGLTLNPLLPRRRKILLKKQIIDTGQPRWPRAGRRGRVWAGLAQRLYGSELAAAQLSMPAYLDSLQPVLPSEPGPPLHGQ